MSERTDGSQEAAERVQRSRLDDSCYRALSTARRRRVLSVLLDGRERDIDELATLLVGAHAADTNSMATPTDRRRARIHLRHVDVPRLTDADLVRHDRERDTIRLGDVPQPVHAVLGERDG